MKKNKKLHSYIMFLLIICILLGMFLDDAKDFFVGFLAGWNEMKSIEEARLLFGDIAQKIGLFTMGIALIITNVCCYKKLRNRVTKPIEQLSDNMHEVSKGNLSIRSKMDGDFEIIGIQKSFNTMVEELENAKKLREITELKNQQLYAGIAHDLKTPMTMIMGYAKVLEQNEALTEENRKRYINTIIEQTEHTNALLDSLLSYTKLENQSYQLKMKKRDIVECLRECVANYYPTMEKAKIQMELLLPDNAIEYTFDDVEIKRVFTNLLSNMVKHNPEKTACIIQLEEIYNEEERIIRIIIADNGPKISEDLQETIFDTFVVGDASRSTKNGSGLGLSISKRIIERHGGSLYYINDWKNSYKCFVIDLEAN